MASQGRGGDKMTAEPVLDESGEPLPAAAMATAIAEERATKTSADREAAISRQREKRNGHAPDIHRQLPQDPEAERAFLSSILLSPREVMELCEEKGIGKLWFHLPAHGLIFARLWEMANAGKSVDFITLTAELRKTGELEQAGGAAFVTELFTLLPTAANARHYAETLEEMAFFRGAIKTGTEMAARAWEQENREELRTFAETALAEMADVNTAKKQQSLKDSVFAVMDKIDKGKCEETFGLSTGYPNLDAVARGLRAGNMVGIGGETGCGKTSLVLNLVHNLCVKRGIPTAVFSLEMDKSEVTEVLLQIGSGTNIDAATEQRVADEEIRGVGVAAAKLAQSPLTIRDETDLNILQIRSIARRIKPRLIVVDYAQLVAGGKRRYERSDLEIADVSRNCKLMAGELGATVIVISQLNDDGKAAGSRSLVKDSNQWWIIEETGEETRQIQICKQRRGKKAIVDFRFIGGCQKFLPKAL